jgi:hypothetical protein
MTIKFNTYLRDPYFFDGNSQIFSTYFNEGLSSLALQTTNLGYEHESFGIGVLQTWELVLSDPGGCVDGPHTEYVDLDLFTSPAPSPKERIQFSISLEDTYRQECANNIGTVNVVSEMYIDVGSGYVRKYDNEINTMVNAVVYISMRFYSVFMPNSTELTSVNIYNDSSIICEDCMSRLSFVCEDCINSESVMEGSVYNFSIAMSSNIFVQDASQDFVYSFEFQFAFMYGNLESHERRQLSSSSNMNIPLNIHISQYDCLSPAGFFGDAHSMSCEAPGTTHESYCSRSAAGWKQITSCETAPNNDLNSFYGNGTIFFVLFFSLSLVLVALMRYSWQTIWLRNKYIVVNEDLTNETIG